MTVYVDSDELKASLSLTGTTFADDDIDLNIDAAGAMIDDELGRRFDKQTSTRLYTPVDRDLLEIDDLVTLTTLRVDTAGDGTWTAWAEDTDFRLEPLNAAELDQPWTHVRALRTQHFTVGEFSLVEIAGTFGWQSPPKAVVRAAKLIATQLLMRDRSAPYGVIVAGADVGAVAYIARHDPHLAGLLGRLSRRSETRSLQLS